MKSSAIPVGNSDGLDGPRTPIKMSAPPGSTFFLRSSSMARVVVRDLSIFHVSQVMILNSIPKAREKASEARRLSFLTSSGVNPDAEGLSQGDLDSDGALRFALGGGRLGFVGPLEGGQKGCREE